MEVPRPCEESPAHGTGREPGKGTGGVRHLCRTASGVDVVLGVAGRPWSHFWETEAVLTAALGPSPFAFPLPPAILPVCFFDLFNFGFLNCDLNAGTSGGGRRSHILVLLSRAAQCGILEVSLPNCWCLGWRGSKQSVNCGGQTQTPAQPQGTAWCLLTAPQAEVTWCWPVIGQRLPSSISQVSWLLWDVPESWTTRRGNGA